MSVHLRRMTDEEYGKFYQWSIRQQADELMNEQRISYDDALDKAKNEVNEMLPDGLNTEGSRLMVIADESSGEDVGFLWTINEETEGRKQTFICDFAIWQ